MPLAPAPLSYAPVVRPGTGAGPRRTSCSSSSTTATTGSDSWTNIPRRGRHASMLLRLRRIRFTSAHAAAALCNPSRTSILTGISPGRSGVRINLDQPWRQFLPNAVSLNQAFRKSGYYTVGLGKIFHGNPANSDLANWHEYTPNPTAQRRRLRRFPSTVSTISPAEVPAAATGAWSMRRPRPSRITSLRPGPRNSSPISIPPTRGHSFSPSVSGRRIHPGIFRERISIASQPAIRAGSSCRRR